VNLGHPPVATQLLLISAVVGLIGPSLYGQEIQIRVLNGRNGKPISNECLNVSFGSWHGADLIAPVSDQGVIVLHLKGNRVSADAVPHPACVKTAFVGPKLVRDNPDAIALSGDYYVDCQESAEVRAAGRLEGFTPPSYPIRKILESGMTAANTCGKFRAEAKPGELIFFVRPRTFLERMRE
jgi:hypothetical protein